MIRTGNRECSRQWRNKSSFAALAAIFLALGASEVATPASAAVVIFDGFGDADLNNNGVPLEAFDVDVSSSGDGTPGDAYEPVQNDEIDTIFADGTMVQEVTAVENAGDRGISWYHLAGFTSSGTGDPKVNARIVNDAAGFLPDTNPAIGFTSGNTPGRATVAAIDDGLALAIESKGRNSQLGGFFDDDYSDGNQGRVSLGPEVGDAVSVSFDFRVWMSAPNFNAQSKQHVPTKTELRFGLYQDTDSQLGMTNPTAGVNGTPAVWGEEGGLLRGDGGGVGGAGDHGWFARLPIEDPDEPDASIPTFKPPAGGVEARITEELNHAPDSDPRIQNGSQDTIAAPDAANPNFVNMSYRKVYNISLTLDRIDDLAGETVRGTLDVTDRATGQVFSLSGFDRLDEINAANDPDGGFESDAWDYFVIGLSGSFDDFDWIIDNFTVEVIGSNEPGGDDADFDGDGDVDGRDFLTWQRGLGLTGQPNKSTGDANGNGTVDAADLAVWRAQFGDEPGIGGIPEPASGLLATMALIAVMAGRQRRRPRIS